MIKAPCKNCLIRHVGCHGDCGEYKSFREDLEQRNEQRLQILESQNISTYAKTRQNIAFIKNTRRRYESCR